MEQNASEIYPAGGKFCLPTTARERGQKRVICGRLKMQGTGGGKGEKGETQAERQKRGKSQKDETEGIQNKYKIRQKTKENGIKGEKGERQAERQKRGRPQRKRKQRE